MDELQLLETLARELANHPEDVKVDRRLDERGVFLVLHLHESDISYFIGKEGSHARSLRTILKWHGVKNNKCVSMQIFENPERKAAFMEKRQKAKEADFDIDKTLGE